MSIIFYEVLCIFQFVVTPLLWSAICIVGITCMYYLLHYTTNFYIFLYNLLFHSLVMWLLMSPSSSPQISKSNLPLNRPRPRGVLVFLTFVSQHRTTSTSRPIRIWVLDDFYLTSTSISNAYQPTGMLSISSCTSVTDPSCKRQFYTRIYFTFVMTFKLWQAFQKNYEYCFFFWEFYNIIDFLSLFLLFLSF